MIKFMKNIKTAIILHGKPSKEEYYDLKYFSPSNEHWFPWLQHQLLLNDILTQTPELPRPYEPVYKDWKKVFEQFLIDENTILVGHSCGAGFLVRYLSENKIKVGKVVLVAPYLGNKEENKDVEFFDFKIDSDLPERTQGLAIFNSKDDNEEIQKSVEKIRSEILGVNYREFENHGHFCSGEMKSREFPELLEEVLN